MALRENHPRSFIENPREKGVRLPEEIPGMNVRAQLNGLSLKLKGIQVLINWQKPLDLHIVFFRVVLVDIIMKIIQIWRMMIEKICSKVIE